MKIVIDIDDNDYNEIKEDSEKFRKKDMVIPRLYKVIISGTPLPKGHGRLIDADAVLEDPYGNTYKDINIAETIIEADKEVEK